jgi:galactokinase
MSGIPQALKMYSYCPTKYEGSFAFPTDFVFVIMVSGYVAEKTGAKMGDYNNAAFLAFDGARAWAKANAAHSNITTADFGFPIFNAATTGECNLAEVVRYVVSAHPTWSLAQVKESIARDIAKFDSGDGPFPLGKERNYRKGQLVERFNQFFEESEVCVPQIAKAFQQMSSDSEGLKIAGRGLLSHYGNLSHEMTVRQLHNTVEVTEILPLFALDAGAVAASAFGAGFGGSCWALVKADAADEFMTTVTDVYKAHCRKRFAARHTESHSLNMEFAICQEKFSTFKMVPGPGAFALCFDGDSRL